MKRTAFVPAVLCLAIAAYATGAAGAVRVAIGRAAAVEPLTFPVNLGSRPLGTIEPFLAELCFYEQGSSPASCNGSGTVSVQQAFAAPFYTAGIFVETLATGRRTAVAAPVALAAGERVSIVNEWIATTLGPAASTQILRLTPTGEPAEDIVVNASGDGTANGPCAFEHPGLCLAGGRFRVHAHFVTSTGTEGAASGLGLTADTGYFFFFDPSNVEAVVKVLDACGFNGRYWVFAGGLTDVRTEITVTDSEHDAVQVYFNPQGTPFQPIQDTAAFATCP